MCYLKSMKCCSEKGYPEYGQYLGLEKDLQTLIWLGTVHLSGSEESVVDSKSDPQTVVPVRTSPWLSKGSALALQTAMSLISMTSPRNFQIHSTALAPSFVEFDMSMEGYGYCCSCFYFSSSGVSKLLC